jgi:MATE family multidrug resistance protein
MGAIGALRGYKDTLGPMKILAVSYWGIGLPVGVVLSITSIITEPMGAVGMWVGICSGLCVAAILMVRRVRNITNHFIYDK